MTYERIRRAAILVASLDEPLAEQLLAGLSSADRERVLVAAERIDEIDPDEQRDVLAEFRRLSHGTRRSFDAGVEAAFSKSDEASTAPRGATVSAGGETAGSTVDAGDAAAMAELLVHEHPQIVAAALARLGEERSAAVFAALPLYLQAETLERLATLAPPDEEAVQEIESQLHERLRQRREHAARAAAGAELVQKILARTPDAQRVVLLERLGQPAAPAARPAVAAPQHAAPDPLAQQAWNLAQAMRRPQAPVAETAPLADRSEDLGRLSDEALVSALRQAGEQTVLRALAASGDAFLDRVAGMLPRRQARKLRGMLRNLGPVRLADLHAAQHELLRLAEASGALERAA